jgi:hypothetical protein
MLPLTLQVYSLKSGLKNQCTDGKRVNAAVCRWRFCESRRRVLQLQRNRQAANKTARYCTITDYMLCTGIRIPSCPKLDQPVRVPYIVGCLTDTDGHSLTADLRPSFSSIASTFLPLCAWAGWLRKRSDKGRYLVGEASFHVSSSHSAASSGFLSQLLGIQFPHGFSWWVGAVKLNPWR